MSRRNPLNKRYQKETQPKGKTKKSAASAKPARKQGTGRATAGSASQARSGKGTSKGTTARGSRMFPDTPEYKEARRKWWIAVGVAAAILALSFALTLEQVQDAIPLEQATLFTISSAMVWSTAGLVAVSWWIDIKQIRPMMKAHQAGLPLDEYLEREAAKSKPKIAHGDTDTADTTEEER